MGSIDRMDWHYGGDFPEGLPTENGGTHIGMYLAWVINNDLIGEMHLEDASESILAVKNRQITGRDFLIQECDEKFWNDDLNEEGLAFTNYYYSDDSGMKLYIQDYEQILSNEVESTYYVEGTWNNYDKIARVIDIRYKEWKEIK